MRNTLIMIANWSTCSFCYYLLTYYTNYFKGSIYSNTCLLGIADIVATLTVRLLQLKFETKSGFIISYALVFVISLLYYAVMDHLVGVAV